MTANSSLRTRNVTVACAQMACTWDLPANVDRAEKLIREAAARGAQIVQIQELFEAPYFCIEQHAKHFELAIICPDRGGDLLGPVVPRSGAGDGAPRC